MASEGTAARRIERMGVALRRLVHRGATSQIRNLLTKVRPADVAVMLRGLTTEHQQSVFKILVREFPDSVSDLLTELEPGVRYNLLAILSPEQIAEVLERAPVDDAVYLVQEMPREMKAQVLDLVDLRELTEVQDQLDYEDDTAGRIMDPQYFALPEAESVQDAVSAIRDRADVEMIFYLYVIDEGGHLVGVISLRQLLIARGDRTLGEVMQRDIIKVETHTDQEEVAQLAARYDLLAIPVTDSRNRLVGIVTVDDIVDVVADEATEDFYKMVGTTDEEIQYQENAFRVAGIRLPWLLVNLVGLLIGGILVEFYQKKFSSALFLLSFLPAVMGMSGNSGSQTSTIMVRSLATGQITLGDGRTRRFLFQQIRVGLVVGVVTGLVVAVAAAIKQENLYFALAVGAALFLGIALSSLAGAVIPVAFRRLGIDPAVAAGPLVTTSSDILGIFIYFSLVALAIPYIL